MFGEIEERFVRSASGKLETVEEYIASLFCRLPRQLFTSVDARFASVRSFSELQLPKANQPSPQHDFELARDLIEDIYDLIASECLKFSHSPADFGEFPASLRDCG